MNPAAIVVLGAASLPIARQIPAALPGCLVPWSMV
jgi:hypothetical protein